MKLTLSKATLQSLRRHTRSGTFVPGSVQQIGPNEYEIEISRETRERLELLRFPGESISQTLARIIEKIEFGGTQ